MKEYTRQEAYKLADASYRDGVAVGFAFAIFIMFLTAVFWVVLFLP